MLLLGHSAGGGIVLAYVQQYPSHAEKLVLLDHELPRFNDSATHFESAMKCKKDVIYSVALKWLQNFKADTDEGMQDELNGILSFYFANPAKSVPEFFAAMQDSPSSWALYHQRTADRERLTYLIDDLDKVEAKTLIVVGREDAICSVKAAEKAHAGKAELELVIFEDGGHSAWMENSSECLGIIGHFLRE